MMQNAEVDAILEHEDLKTVALYRLATPHVTAAEWTVIGSFTRIYRGPAMLELLLMLANRNTSVLVFEVRRLGRRIREAKEGGFTIHTDNNGWNVKAKREFLKQIVKARTAITKQSMRMVEREERRGQ